MTPRINWNAARSRDLLSVKDRSFGTGNTQTSVKRFFRQLNSPKRWSKNNNTKNNIVNEILTVRELIFTDFFDKLEILFWINVF